MIALQNCKNLWATELRESEEGVDHIMQMERNAIDLLDSTFKAFDGECALHWIRKKTWRLVIFGDPVAKAYFKDRVIRWMVDSRGEETLWNDSPLETFAEDFGNAIAEWIASE